MKRYFIIILALCFIIQGCDQAIIPDDTKERESQVQPENITPKMADRDTIKPEIDKKQIHPNQVWTINLKKRSVDTLKNITSSGADENSIKNLKKLISDTQEAVDILADKPNKEYITNHLTNCIKIYNILLSSYGEDIIFKEKESEINSIIDKLDDTSGYQPEINQLLPTFNDHLEEDYRFALSAIYMNNLYTKEKEQGIVSISFAGDTTFGQYPEVEESCSFNNEFSLRNDDLSFPLSIVSAYFKNDSFTILNCEGTFTDSDEMLQKRFRFKGVSDYANMFVNGGVEAVNLANNHTMDYLQKGFDDTRKNLDNCGIKYYGDQEYLIYEAKGVNFGFFGYDFFTNQHYYGFDCAQEMLERDINILKNKGADVIIATFHWGLEYYNDAGYEQTQIGRMAIDIGADMVVGHHPHVLQGVEIYKDKPIVYSLGNFAFGGDEDQKDNGDTMIFRQTFTVIDGKVNIGDYMIIPVNVSTANERNNYIPRPLFSDEAERVKEKILNISHKMADGIEETNYFY